MLQPLPVNEPNIFAFKASGKLTDADYQAFIPMLENMIKRYGKISLLMELENFKGWDNKALWDDFKIGAKHDHDIERIAIIGEKNWQQWMSWLADLATEGEVRYFKRDDLYDAWDWLRENALAQEAQTEEFSQQTLPAYQHILIPTDFSDHSNDAIKRGLELAKQYETKVTLLHVHDYAPPMVEYSTLLPTAPYFEDDELFKHSAKHLEDIAKATQFPNIKHETIWGQAKSGIISFAEAQKVDLIVMGSHGRHGLARILGSTAAGIVNGGSRCDVLVIKGSQ